MAVLEHALGVDAIGTEPIAGEFLISSPVSGFTPIDAINTVGTRYEVAINGEGLMLADTADQENYTRQSSQIDLPRFATGETPFSEAADRYTFVAFGDMSDGAGQRFRDREDASQAAFWDSRRVDPFSEPGRLLCLKSLASVRAVTVRTTASYYLDKPDYPLVFLQAADGWYLSADNSIRLVSSGAEHFNVAAARIRSMHTNGVTTLYAVSDGSFRSTVGTAAVTTPTVNGIANIGGTAVTTSCVYWSTVAQRWCVGVDGNGVFGFTTLSGSATPYANEMGTNIYRHSVATGGSSRTATIRSITDGGGFVWYSVTDYPAGNFNSIYGWKAGSADAPAVAYRFSNGEVPVSVFYHQGNLFCRTIAPTARGDQFTVSIFRFVQQGAQLTPVAILDLGSLSTTTTSTLFRSHILGGWAAYGSRVYFGWKSLHSPGTYGTACIDLASGGYAKWWDLDGTAADENVVDGIAVSTTGVPYVLVPGLGLYSASGAEDDGWLSTSLADLGSSVDKQIDSITLMAQGHDAATASGDVRVLISDNHDGPWVGEFPPDGALQNVFTLATVEVKPVGMTYEQFAIRIELTPGGTGTFHDKTVVRLHPLGLTDEMLQMHINCSDRPEGLGNSRLPGGDGKGSERARWLQSLTQTVVGYQDIDWREGDAVEYWEILSVEVTGRNSRQSGTGRASQNLTAKVTMRRFVK